MTEQSTPYTLDQIGTTTVRFSSSGVFETHKDQMVDPYAMTRMPKEAQVEGSQFSPQAKGIFPAIVLLHDRWGLTSQVKDMAMRLTCEGYVVLTPNLYGRQGGMVTANAEVSEALMNRLNEQHALKDINACCEFLNANLTEDTLLEQTKRNVHAVVGFGMGGTLAIRFAGLRKRLRGAVAFYGKLPIPQETVKGLYCPILYHATSPDESVTAEEIEQFQQAAKNEGKSFEVHSYPEAPPEFWNEMRPDSYRADAFQRSWKTTVDFLHGVLKTT